MKISVVIITFQEATYIHAVVRSVQPVADEILVVDSGSTDGTRQIAEAAGARVLLHPFTDYVSQKNWANTQAAGDYIISLDGDEVLSDEAVAFLKSWKAQGNPEVYLCFPRLNFIGEKPVAKGGWYPDYKIRGWKKDTAAWQGPVPHEKLSMQKSRQLLYVTGDILHYSYTSLDEFAARSAQYGKLKAASRKYKGNFLLGAIKYIAKWIKTGLLQGGLFQPHGWRFTAISARESWVSYKGK